MARDFLIWLLEAYKLIGISVIAAVVFVALVLGPTFLACWRDKNLWFLLYLITYPMLIGIIQAVSF